ncbi:DoxX family protein [Aquimarina algiphila]|uniref:DoxX family protein n=1 Tax=Aquimarina algiphila TaxID=2047982 RepID=UPI00232CABF4|nr:DoxX family protein [Aquimarina algiphila]
MKVNKIIYWIATVLMAAQFTFSAMMYFVKHDYIKSAYINLGFPIWIIYPLGTAKILALTVILIRQSKVLKEWVYAGYFLMRY